MIKNQELSMKKDSFSMWISRGHQKICNLKKNTNKKYKFKMSQQIETVTWYLIGTWRYSTLHLNGDWKQIIGYKDDDGAIWREHTWIVESQLGSLVWTEPQLTTTFNDTWAVLYAVT